jgi:hypothetical protein
LKDAIVTEIFAAKRYSNEISVKERNSNGNTGCKKLF